MTAARSRELCIMACVFCKDPLFHKWLQQGIEAVAGPIRTQMNEDGSKAFILARCLVASRNDLDTNPAAAQRFHDLIRKPFLEWREEERRKAAFFNTSLGEPYQEGAPC